MWSKERGLCQLGNKSDVSLTRTYKKYKSNIKRQGVLVKVSVKENFSTLLDFVFFFGFFGMSGS